MHPTRTACRASTRASLQPHGSARGDCYVRRVVPGTQQRRPSPCRDDAAHLQGGQGVPFFIKSVYLLTTASFFRLTSRKDPSCSGTTTCVCLRGGEGRYDARVGRSKWLCFKVDTKYCRVLHAVLFYYSGPFGRLVFLLP